MAVNEDGGGRVEQCQWCRLTGESGEWITAKKNTKRQMTSKTMKYSDPDPCMFVFYHQS